MGLHSTPQTQGLKATLDSMTPTGLHSTPQIRVLKVTQDSLTPMGSHSTPQIQVPRATLDLLTPTGLHSTPQIRVLKVTPVMLTPMGSRSTPQIQVPRVIQDSLTPTDSLWTVPIQGLKVIPDTLIPNTFALNCTDTGASGDSGFGDSNTFALNCTDTGASGDSGFGDSNTFSLNTTDTGASGGSGFGDSNTFSLNTTDTEQNATISGTVYYSGIVNGAAIVSAKDANGSLIDHATLPDGNGSYSLSVPIGDSYDFKAFVDGTNNYNINPGEPYEHIGEWNATLGKFNLAFVDGNLSGIDFHLTDKDQDGDGYLDWIEVQAGSDLSDVNSTPNQQPTELNATSSLAFNENLPVGSVIAEFNATDPDGDSLAYSLVDGNGSTHNHLFTLETNGTLKTATSFDYETNASSYSIRVQAKDEHNASIEKEFTRYPCSMFMKTPLLSSCPTAI